MPVIAQIHRPKIPLQLPNKARLLTEDIERCGHCTLLWPSVDMVEESRADGLRRACPNASSPSTDIEFTTSVQERVANEMERYIPLPRLSDMAMALTVPATVVTIEDSAGERVTPRNPLPLLRSGSGTLVLIGVGFTAADTIVAPTGVTVAGTGITDGGQRNELSLTVASDAPRGLFSMTFNGSTLKNVLQVR